MRRGSEFPLTFNLVDDSQPSIIAVSECYLLGINDGKNSHTYTRQALYDIGCSFECQPLPQVEQQDRDTNKRKLGRHSANTPLCHLFTCWLDARYVPAGLSAWDEDRRFGQTLW